MLVVSAVTAGEPISPQGRYFPVHQSLPPGQAARILQQRRGNEYYVQPVRFSLPTYGSVGVFSTGRSHYGAASLKALPSINSTWQVGLGVGHTYRLRISDLPQHPQVELFPSVEILDRLHPPHELKHDFPIPINLTDDEIEAAISGKLVTKAIYLEQPQLVMANKAGTNGIRTVTLPPNRNILAEADKRGRPLAILRLGSRRPVPNANNYGFFGASGPIEDSNPSHQISNGPPKLRFLSGQQASR